MKPPESREDLLSIQQDAIRRVREMQRRATRSVEQSNQMMHRTTPSHSEMSYHPPRPGAYGEQWKSSSAPDIGEVGHGYPPPPPVPIEGTNRPIPPSESPLPPLEADSPKPIDSRREKRKGFMGLLDGLGLEDDSLLILLLLYVLWKNDADQTLLMALAYILL
nr:hypothetical protein [uncultured Solibaculum sp.]